MLAIHVVMILDARLDFKKLFKVLFRASWLNWHCEEPFQQIEFLRLCRAAEKIGQFLTHYVECGVARARGDDLESTVFVGLAFENLVEVNKYVPCWVKFILRDPS